MYTTRWSVRPVTVGAVVLGAWGLAFLGCDSSGSTGPSGTSSLAVTITTPAGVTPSVVVSISKPSPPPRRSLGSCPGATP
jgi:hypothetical protein